MGVTFRYKNYRETHPTPKTMTLSATEFLGRFLFHVLPAGFPRIRYYGFLGRRHRTEKLARCRRLLGTASPAPPTATDRTDYRERPNELVENLRRDGRQRCVRRQTFCLGRIDSSCYAPHTRFRIPSRRTPAHASIPTFTISGTVRRRAF
jgi:hypothetical protein